MLANRSADPYCFLCGSHFDNPLTGRTEVCGPHLTAPDGTWIKPCKHEWFDLTCPGDRERHLVCRKCPTKKTEPLERFLWPQ